MVRNVLPVARERRDARPRAGRPAPGGTLHQSSEEAVSASALRACSTGPREGWRAPGPAGTSLTRTGPTGKFHQVAPNRCREADVGARLILENSTVCQKSTN